LGRTRAPGPVGGDPRVGQVRSPAATDSNGYTADIPQILHGGELSSGCSMWNRLVSGLAAMVWVLALLMLLSSGLDAAVGLGDHLPLKAVQSSMAVALLALSAVLAIVNLLLTRHPFYEYWITVTIGAVVGAIYLP